MYDTSDVCLLAKGYSFHSSFAPIESPMVALIAMRNVTHSGHTLVMKAQTK